MDSLKSEPANGTVDDIAGDWYGQALLVGFMVAAGAFFEISLYWGGTVRQLSLSTQLWLSLLPVHGVGTAAVLWICWLRLPSGERLPALFLRPVTLGKRWWWAWLGVPVFYGAMTVLVLWALLVLQRMGYTPHGMPLLHLLQSGPPFTPVSGVSLFTTILLVVPFTEEILFRVVLFESLRGLGDTASAIITAVVFAGVHMVPEQFLALFVLGFVLQILRLKTGSLLPCILVHAGINTIGLVALLLTVA